MTQLDTRPTSIQQGWFLFSCKVSNWRDIGCEEDALSTLLGSKDTTGSLDHQRTDFPETEPWRLTPELLFWKRKAHSSHTQPNSRIKSFCSQEVYMQSGKTCSKGCLGRLVCGLQAPRPNQTVFPRAWSSIISLREDPVATPICRWIPLKQNSPGSGDNTLLHGLTIYYKFPLSGGHLH